MATAAAAAATTAEPDAAANVAANPAACPAPAGAVARPAASAAPAGSAGQIASPDLSASPGSTQSGLPSAWVGPRTMRSCARPSSARSRASTHSSRCGSSRSITITTPGRTQRTHLSSGEHQKSLVGQAETVCLPGSCSNKAVPALPLTLPWLARARFAGEPPPHPHPAEVWSGAEARDFQSRDWQEPDLDSGGDNRGALTAPPVSRRSEFHIALCAIK